VPLKSQSQRSYLYAKHPEAAKEWSVKYGEPKNLPDKKAKKKKSPWMDMKSSNEKGK